MYTAALVTVSDKGYAGLREDKSGPILHDRLAALGLDVVYHTIVPDDRAQISETLCDLADQRGVDLVVTTGGTGAAPRDVTPEATLSVIEREMPGLAELIRWEGTKRTPLAVLSRGVVGIRKSTLIINLAGSPRAVQEGMDILTPVLLHALQMLKGENLEHEYKLVHEHKKE
jgi:molybdopterin adenylyltransferase